MTLKLQPMVFSSCFYYIEMIKKKYNEETIFIIMVLFNENSGDVLLMVYSREVPFYRRHRWSVVRIAVIDKSSPAMIQAIACCQRDIIYLLYEIESISTSSQKS